MRVIAGSLKGRRLKPPSWDGLRPTSDKLRETLFNILAPRVAQARLLDGCAGTGALGIEALSRGAASATFVDADRRAVALIEENAAHCGILNRCAIIHATFARACQTLRAKGASEPGESEPFNLQPFDIVLLDPPYKSEHASDLETLLTAAASVLAPDGVVVLEHAKRAVVPESAGRLRMTRCVPSGDSALSFYELR